MTNYSDNIDIVMTALAEIRHHIDDRHYSEVKPKITTAAYSLGQLAATCNDLEKIANRPVQLNAKMQATHDKQKSHINELEREDVKKELKVVVNRLFRN